MKKIFHSAWSISLLLTLGYSLEGCKKRADVTVSTPKPEVTLLGGSLLPQVLHLYKDTVYIMNQPLSRGDGQQLIIDAGTVIKVSPNANITIDINPGGKIQANGTADNPVVFTSNAEPGTQQESWGRLSINGKSSDNTSGIIGDVGDSSGSLHYVRIEFGGLTLTGVGNGTTVDHVQVSYCYGAPAFEFNGGTFNAHHLVSYACVGSADFHITRGFTGKLQHLLAYRIPYFGPKGNTLTGMLIDNDAYGSQNTPLTLPIISNLTVIGPNAQPGTTDAYKDTLTGRPASLVTTANAHFRIRNSLFLAFPEGGWYLDDSLTVDGLVKNTSEFTWSIVHSNDSARAFYLKPNTYTGAGDLATYMLEPGLHNALYKSADDFMFTDAFHYEKDAPDPMPKGGSPVLTGADFSGNNYGDAFFEKVSYKGALGNDNWLQGWINFHPLQTLYNYPQ